MRRVGVTASGIVQGVGFRPFVHRAATARGLSGWVANGSGAVRLEIEGAAPDVDSFLVALRSPPPPARVDTIEARELPLLRESGFVIRASSHEADARPVLPADRALCEACAAETDDPRERRFRYPFTNCTQCGPRYSIVEALPYDRAHTSMKDFALCDACAAEYGEPSDRRFHAQPIACPACGPELRLTTEAGDEIARGPAALDAAARALEGGAILALQGLGGFQLLVDATNEGAVTSLRSRKQRDDKPFAVMLRSLEAVRASCSVSDAEAEALSSPEAPIVLLRRVARRDGIDVVGAVAPRSPWLGVLLPYTPLHRLLLAAVDRPLVCTSGNVAEEPMCTDEQDARARLGAIADIFLVHDRPVVRPLDDSVGRVGPSGFELLRRARGFAPLPLAIADRRSILATGAHLKSTIALAKAGLVVVSQHLGDLSSAAAVLLHEHTVSDLTRFFEVKPEIVACDLHPDYASTRLASLLAHAWDATLVQVQHHHAHVAACMAEHGLPGPVLGLAWDGSGLGTDGTLWGGEALVVDGASFRRVAHLRPFALPGGERAMREPRRAALGLLHEIYGASVPDDAPPEWSGAPRRALLSMLTTGVGCVRTTSMGRLFDAVAALAGVRGGPGYEGQAASELEAAADGVDGGGYPFDLREGDPLLVDWEPLVRAVLDDRAHGVGAGVVSARFHEALVDLAEAIAVRAGLARVVLSGGCFQNRRLSERVRRRLASRGFDVFSPRLYPPNDGGLSLGQLFVASSRKDWTDVPRHPW